MKKALLATMVLASWAHGQDFLVVVLDDVGTDRVACYGENPKAGPTPTIDGLAAQGIKFTSFWASPKCSPTRAGLFTGRHSFRTGVGDGVNPEGDLGEGLDPEEVILPEMLSGYDFALVGKWHLGTLEQDSDHASKCGVPIYSGGRWNLLQCCGGLSYFDFPKWVNGREAKVARYATTDEVDDAVRFWRRGLASPRCLVLAFHTAHAPLHRPPPNLHTFFLSGSPWDSPVKHYRAAVEAADTELDRLLAEVDLETTTVFVLGDNGTWPAGISPPQDPSRGKGTPYEGGIRVPLIVAGQAVAQSARGSECDALVTVWDLAATLVDLAAQPPAASAVDSVSFAHLLADPTASGSRVVAYSEKFLPNHTLPPYETHARAAREGAYKLLEFKTPGAGVVEELYELENDPLELTNLLDGLLSPEEQAAYDALRAYMDGLW